MLTKMTLSFIKLGVVSLVASALYVPILILIAEGVGLSATIGAAIAYVRAVAFNYWGHYYGPIVAIGHITLPAQIHRRFRYRDLLRQCLGDSRSPGEAWNQLRRRTGAIVGRGSRRHMLHRLLGFSRTGHTGRCPLAAEALRMDKNVHKRLYSCIKFGDLP
jgi:hypothetical protein